MHFKTHQALALAGVSEEKLRHWKTQLSPLFGFDGRKTGFTLEQVVALAVVNRAVSGLKVPVATLAPQAQDLFDAVARHLRTGTGATVLFLADGHVSLGGMADLPGADTVVLIRMDLVASHVRNEAIKVAEAQLTLI